MKELIDSYYEHNALGKNESLDTSFDCCCIDLEKKSLDFTFNYVDCITYNKDNSRTPNSYLENCIYTFVKDILKYTNWQISDLESFVDIRAMINSKDGVTIRIPL